ncbi:MAG: hypothetical protein ACFFCZ_10895 [Promethearchaeota archaeon]
MAKLYSFVLKIYVYPETIDQSVKEIQRRGDRELGIKELIEKLKSNSSLLFRAITLGRTIIVYGHQKNDVEDLIMRIQNILPPKHAYDVISWAKPLAVRDLKSVITKSDHVLVGMPISLSLMVTKLYKDVVTLDLTKNTINQPISERLPRSQFWSEVTKDLLRNIKNTSEARIVEFIMEKWEELEDKGEVYKQNQRAIKNIENIVGLRKIDIEAYLIPFLITHLEEDVKSLDEIEVEELMGLQEFVSEASKNVTSEISPQTQEELPIPEISETGTELPIPDLISEDSTEQSIEEEQDVTSLPPLPNDSGSSTQQPVLPTTSEQSTISQPSAQERWKQFGNLSPLEVKRNLRKHLMGYAQVYHGLVKLIGIFTLEGSVLCQAETMTIQSEIEATVRTYWNQLIININQTTQPAIFQTESDIIYFDLCYDQIKAILGQDALLVVVARKEAQITAEDIRQLNYSTLSLLQ